MADYDPNNQIDAELLSYGMEDCGCDPLAYYETYPPCVLCGEELKVNRLMSHLHYKGSLYHDTCLLLAVLREKERKEA